MNRNLKTFIGCESEYSEAKIVVFGAPFDSTTSFRPGTRFASSTMRNESYGIETFSPYQNRDLDDIYVFDGGDLELGFGNPKKALEKIEKYTLRVIEDDKIPCMIGGEHLVTYGAVKAITEKFPELHIIHFDAHADLRDEYLGEKLSHATVMRRIWDIIGDNKIFQFGIRSGDREELLWAKKHVFIQMFNFDLLPQIVENLKGKPVYLSVDLDVLDPSVLPGTGTPEAGGVSFNELLKACMELTSIDIVGLDINELSPTYDQSGASTAVACKLLRELLLIVYG